MVIKMGRSWGRPGDVGSYFTIPDLDMHQGGRWTFSFDLYLASAANRWLFGQCNTIGWGEPWFGVCDQRFYMGVYWYGDRNFMEYTEETVPIGKWMRVCISREPSSVVVIFVDGKQLTVIHPSTVNYYRNLSQGPIRTIHATGNTWNSAWGIPISWDPEAYFTNFRMWNSIYDYLRWGTPKYAWDFSETDQVWKDKIQGLSADFTGHGEWFAPRPPHFKSGILVQRNQQLQELQAPGISKISLPWSPSRMDDIVYT